jgi:hypothetical protein
VEAARDRHEAAREQLQQALRPLVPEFANNPERRDRIINHWYLWEDRLSILAPTARDGDAADSETARNASTAATREAAIERL